MGEGEWQGVYLIYCLERTTDAGGCNNIVPRFEPYNPTRYSWVRLSLEQLRFAIQRTQSFLRQRRGGGVAPNLISVELARNPPLLDEQLAASIRSTLKQRHRGCMRSLTRVSLNTEVAAQLLQNFHPQDQKAKVVWVERVPLQTVI